MKDEIIPYNPLVFGMNYLNYDMSQEKVMSVIVLGRRVRPTLKALDILLGFLGIKDHSEVLANVWQYAFVVSNQSGRPILPCLWQRIACMTRKNAA